MKWVDGNLQADDAPAPPLAGLAPFETMRAGDRSVPLLARHLARLRQAASRAGLPMTPPADLQAAALALLAQNGHARGVVRVQIRPTAAGVQWVLTTRRAGPATPVRLLPCLQRRPAAAPPADTKAEPRDFQDAVLGEARAGGADDGIVLGPRGELLETAVGNLWLLCDGVWITPPLDGRLLPGIARALVLERARAYGLEVAERPCDLGDLHRAAALALTNAVHGPRAAALPGQPVAELDTALAALWRDLIQD